jgi:hypothetical protein
MHGEIWINISLRLYGLSVHCETSLYPLLCSAMFLHFSALVFSILLCPCSHEQTFVRRGIRSGIREEKRKGHLQNPHLFFTLKLEWVVETGLGLGWARHGMACHAVERMGSNGTLQEETLYA